MNATPHDAASVEVSGQYVKPSEQEFRPRTHGFVRPLATTGPQEGHSRNTGFCETPLTPPGAGSVPSPYTKRSFYLYARLSMGCHCSVVF